MRLDKIGPLAALSLFPLLGFFLLGVGARNIWRGVASSRWPVAAAVVEESTTSVTVDKDSSRRTSAATYTANIVFGYDVNGLRYTTDLIQFGQTVGSGDSSDAELRRVRYPKDAALTVRYHPADPSIATVQPGFHSDALWLPGAGLAFALPGIMFLLMYLGSESEVGGGSMRYGLVFFSAIFMSIGIAMLAGGLVSLWHAHTSQRWPSAAGVILYGKQDANAPAIVESTDGELMQSSGHGNRLIYRFEVAGRRHFSNVRVFGQLAGAGADWEDDIASRYPLGKAVRVSYSPEDPDVAVLEPGINNEAYYLPGAGAAFFLFGLAALLIILPAVSRDF
jgi:hypothetical protein